MINSHLFEKHGHCIKYNVKVFNTWYVILNFILILFEKALENISMYI